VAAGARSAELAGVPVRPVKGQILRLRDPAGPGLVTRTIRTPTAYLVPRRDGRYVLGATVEERGWNRAPTAGGAFELIRDLSEVVPGVLELEVEELSAGLRPGSPDNLPLIGPADRGGLHLATGHYRNGICSRR
jgi:glycine oxidase